MPALLPPDEAPYDDILDEVEAAIHEAYGGAWVVSVEDGLSVNQWLERVQGAGKAAQMHARSGAVGSEEQAWLEMAAIACRRVATLRRIAP